VIGRAFVLALGAAMGLGCATQPAGHFTSAGYVNSTYAYSVPYAEGALVLPNGWVLDNFVSSPDGVVPRKDDGYVTSVELDRDGDRAPDCSLRIATYDLRFVHSAHPGVIWLRTFPYSYHLHEKPLEQLARDYVAYMSASGAEAAVIDDRVPGPPRVNIAVDSQSSWVVAGHPAEVLDVRETALAGTAVRRVRVVLVRPGFMYQHTNRRRETVLYPVLMVAGYSNSPESFELAAADLDILLGQITVQGVSGLIKRGQPEAATAGTDERSEPAEESPGVEENEDDGRPEEGQEPSEASGSENDIPKDAVTPSPLVLDEE